MNPFRRRRFQTGVICALCAGATLVLTLAVGFANARLDRLVARKTPDPERDPVVRLLWEVGTWIPAAEGALRNELVQTGRRAPLSPDLVFLAVDDLSIGVEPLDLDSSAADVPRESRDYRALSLMSQRWPFDREVHALAIDKLIQAGARAVMVDFVFPKPSAGDRPLQTALERHRSKVTIVCNYEPPTDKGGGNASGAGKDRMTLPPTSVLPTEAPFDVIGLANFFPDERDGSIRSARYRVSLRQLAGYNATDEQGDLILSLAARTAAKIGFSSSIPPGLGETFFRFAGPPGTFKPRSFQEIFYPRQWERNFANGAFFKDKIVILGPFGNWSQDFHATSWGVMPGPEVHLNALNALISKSFLEEAPDWFGVASVVGVGMAVFLLSLTGWRPLLRFAIAVAMLAGLVYAARLAYDRFDTYLLTVPPLIALSTSGFGVLLQDFVLERLERARTRKFLERTMSANMVRAVLDSPAFYEKIKSGQRMPVSILFSDIRSFTTMTESVDEHELVVQLNEYLGRMVTCVFRYDGTLDKFIGDAVMAVWGNTPVTKGPKGDACDAVRCALDMLVELRALNEKWVKDGRKPLKIGIGLNFGEVIVGEMGSPQKMEITVIGDVVNTASRFEGLTKEYAVDLLVGENIATLIRDVFVLQPAGFNVPKGKTRPVGIFTVLGEDKDGLRERLQTGGLADYEEGLKRYHARDATGAIGAFERCLALRPGDPLAERHLEKARERLEEGEAADWSDVTVMTKK